MGDVKDPTQIRAWLVAVAANGARVVAGRFAQSVSYALEGAGSHYAYGTLVVSSDVSSHPTSGA